MTHTSMNEQSLLDKGNSITTFANIYDIITSLFHENDMAQSF